MKPIVVFVKDQVYQYVQVRLHKKRFLHRWESLPTGEKKSVSSRQGTHCERKGKTPSTVYFPTLTKCVEIVLYVKSEEARDIAGIVQLMMNSFLRINRIQKTRTTHGYMYTCNSCS